jgi:hypothetical protein
MVVYIVVSLGKKKTKIVCLVWLTLCKQISIYIFSKKQISIY